LVKTILMENKMENEWARKREATWKGTEERTTSLKLRTRKRSVTKLADNPKNSVSENKGVEKNELWAEMSASGAHRDWRGGGEISPGSYQLQWKDSNNWLTESKMPTPMTHQKCSEIPKCDPPNPSNQKSNLFLGVVQEHNHQLQQHTGTTWATLHGTEAAIPPFELIEEQENWKGKKKGNPSRALKPEPRAPSNPQARTHLNHRRDPAPRAPSLPGPELGGEKVPAADGVTPADLAAFDPRRRRVGGGGKRVGEEWRKMGGFWRVQTRWELPFPT
jgi:hypothetical protein